MMANPTNPPYKEARAPTYDPAAPPEIVREYASWSWTPVSMYPGSSAMHRLTRGEETRFLKVVRRGWHPGADDEAQRARWASSYLPVPEVLASGSNDRISWMITRGITGADATDPQFRSDVPALVSRLGRALRAFHSAPVDLCPFSFRIDDALQHAAHRLQRGEIVPARNFHTEFAHLTAAAAVKELMAARPSAEDLVVCHGDFCVPNILLRDDEVVGYVDLGELGVADRWWDLAVATWSLHWNFGTGYEHIFLDAYGIRADPDRAQYYRLLYDVVS